MKIQKQPQLHLETVMGEFLRLNAAGGAPQARTLKSYLLHMRAFTEWCHKQKINPLEATHKQILEYRSFLLGTGLSRSTITLKLCTVRRLYTALQVHGHRSDHPAKGISAPRGEQDALERIKHKYLPEEQARGVLKAARSRQIHRGEPGGKLQTQHQHVALRDQAMITVMLLQGARVCEIVNARVNDLNLKHGTLRLRGKGGKLRTIYLIEATLDALKAWQKVRPKSCERLFVRLSNGLEQDAISDRAVRKVVDSYLEDIGAKRPGISCHALRHTFGTLAHQHGASLEAIRDALGHSSVQTTEIYAKIADARKHNAAQGLQQLAQ